jgi:hypothetical protein
MMAQNAGVEPLTAVVAGIRLGGIGSDLPI